MNDMQQTIINAFNLRHATKRLDSDKKKSQSGFKKILEAGRLSPSSLGLELWKFIVVQNSEIRNKLKEIGWGAKGQLETASHFVILLARKSVTSKSPFVQHMIRDIKQYSEDSIPATEEKFDNFQTSLDRKSTR